VIPLRTCAHARDLQRDLANRRGEPYAAVIARAGSIHHTRQSSTPGTAPDQAAIARNDSLEQGLLIAATEIIQLADRTCHYAWNTARVEAARMAAAIARDEHEFLTHPDWNRPEPPE